MTTNAIAQDYPNWSFATSSGIVFPGVEKEYPLFTLPAGEEGDYLGTLKMHVPAVALHFQYQPVEYSSFDASIVYFSHKRELSEKTITEKNENYGFLLDRDAGNTGKLILFIGGNWSLDGESVTPYLTADIGAAINFLNVQLNGYDYSFNEPFRWSDSYNTVTLAGQAGGGIDVNLGPVALGVLYNYMLIDGYEVPMIYPSGESVNHIEEALSGHKIELKFTIK